MTPIPPITSIEFATALRRCKPPGGWLTSLAVANSGGPDSTCLLYLLKSILASDAAEPLTSDSPKNLLSLAVDHGFQTSSAAMADVAAGNAKRLRIEHVTSSIPWSTAPFPPKPASGIETDARESRYRVLLDNMIAKNVYTLALGHHAGDQQETALMRFMRNGKHRIIDLHAMRHVRRWGMGEGSVGRVGFAGMDGMSRWLVRPLLGFSKDRILATCEARGLEYVTDKTNFQPDLTPRNALRHALSNSYTLDQKNNDTSVSSNELGHKLHEVLGRGYTEGAQQLLAQVADESDQLDEEVTSLLGVMKLASKALVGSFVVPTYLFRTGKHECRERAILRILRYVSPNPWGSPSAEAARSSSSIDTIMRNVLSSKNLKAFTAGSFVMWTPAIIREDRQVVQRKRLEHREEISAWLVTRAVPYSQKGERPASNRLCVDLTAWIHLNSAVERKRWEGMFTAEQGAMAKTDGDVTKTPNQSLVPVSNTSLATMPTSDRLRAHLLWDNRFLLDFDVIKTRAVLATMKNGRLGVEMHPKYFRPVLTLAQGMEIRYMIKIPMKESDDGDAPSESPPELDLKDLVHATFIRTLDNP